MQHETSNVGKGNVEAVSVAIPAVMRTGADGKNFQKFFPAWSFANFKISVLYRFHTFKNIKMWFPLLKKLKKKKYTNLSLAIFNK